ncbi:TDT family transporter [Aciditerrimonas ferrireducens]|jgi:C4-dicarboxylate transporter/malic acid transport protein|uniref:TDT family transporter n=1 Tax=Aciditerrimonas ferrireducens TaxID=667306 RepID=UPI002002C9F8|nr:TDT family transporter [Aciditerrimonas ferrireducens]
MPPTPRHLPSRTPILARLLASPVDQAAEEPALRHVGPNWFASVMGTGIVANAAATLPLHLPGLLAAAEVVWVADGLLFVALLVATAAHWLRHRDAARRHGRDPAMAQFYGAPPMAMLTLGAGALLVGRHLLGLRLGVDLDWLLWGAGTLTGLAACVVVPYRMFTQIEVAADGAFGGWLMPIVPPMVSAGTGPLLLPYLPAGPDRQTLFVGLFALFGMSLVTALIVITLIWSRLVHHGTSGTARVPTLWIVLGPLGQSVTAAGLLAAEAHLAAPAHLAPAFEAFGVLFGVPVWGFAVLWIALVGALTVRTARRGLPFALTWWSFTFPVGTFVTGTTRLAGLTHLPAFRVAAVAAYAGLVGAWATVALGTLRSVLRGEAFTPTPAHLAQPTARKEPGAGALAEVLAG